MNLWLFKENLRYFLNRILLFLEITFIFIVPSVAGNFPATLFPIDHYSQDVDFWLPPNSPDYNIPLVSPEFQQQRMRELYQHLFSTSEDAMSPWSAHFINAVFRQHPGLQELNTALLKQFDNRGQILEELNYGLNYRLQSFTWLNKISENIPLDYSVKYSAQQRAIVVNNSSLRLLPTDDPSFFSYEIPGNGYPFDNLQATQLWAGTPVYIVTYSKDRRWALLISPGAIGWIKTNNLGKVDAQFIQRWQTIARQNLLAIMHTETPIFNHSGETYQFTAYVGAIFPLKKVQKDYYQILIPIRNTYGQAEIYVGQVNKAYAEKMPLPATRANFARLLKELQQRPYGWNGLLAYNDCSAELESLFRPFGIWLPRDSSAQPYVGKIYDQTKFNPQERIDYLKKHGNPLTTIVYIGGHVFLYVGNQAPNNQILTYQNIWGLRPEDNSRRAIIGEAVFLPLLLTYPEDSNLQSLAAKKYFQVSRLDEFPSEPINMSMMLFFQSLKLEAPY